MLRGVLRLTCHTLRVVVSSAVASNVARTYAYCCRGRHAIAPSLSVVLLPLPSELIDLSGAAVCGYAGRHALLERQCENGCATLIALTIHACRLDRHNRKDRHRCLCTAGGS